MKKHLHYLLFLIVVFIGNHLYAQHGISIGITPYGKVGIRPTEDKTDLLTYHYSFSNPIYQLGYEKHLTRIKDLLLEACYAKVDFEDEMGSYHLNTNCYGFYGFQGFNLIPQARIQFPIYIGIGAIYYQELKEAGFYIDFAARARLKLYLTNRIALYGGAFYNLGFGVNKTMERRYGVDSGILFSF
jgi:hypothetical protein